MSGYDFVQNAELPHVGGNIWQGDPATFAPRAWAYMLERFAARTVLDLGSGRGHAANWFASKGARVVAIDGDPANVNGALYPTVLHDLTTGPIRCRVDLVHCQEVVEHIEEIHLPSLLGTMASGDVILMSHAEPGQPGHHHVNCQPGEYWIGKLAAHGFNWLQIDTDRVRKMASDDGAWHLARSGLVFARRL
jgi:hypothetical protein